MKAQKKLNVVLIVLIIILISIISFVGIYHVDKNQMVSVLPDYILGTNISGYRKVTLELKGSQAETGSASLTLGEADLNVEENVVESTEESTNNATSEEQQEEENTVSEEDVKNYKTSAEIIKSRLKSVKVDDFNISVDGGTGKIELTLPENNQTDTILSDITQVGKFEITDTNTGDVLMTNDDIRNVSIEKNESYGYTLVQMNINFNGTGSRKFRDITKDYNENAVIETENVVEDETGNEVSGEISNETTENEIADDGTGDEVTDAETTNNETTENETTDTEEKKAKTVTLKIDDSELLTTGFSEVIDNGVLALTLGTSTDKDEIQQSLYSGYNLAAILENEPLPIEYEVTENLYVESTIDSQALMLIIELLVGIAVIISVFLIAKFKMKGLLGTILSIGYIALLLITIRYTNVTISLEGILAVGLAFIMNSIFNYLLFSKLKNDELSKEERIKRYYDSIKMYSLMLIPALIMSLVCCFTNWDTIYSFGMILFWGIVISILYNLTVTNILVRNK